MANPSLLPAYYYSLCFLLIFSCACSLARQLPHQQSQFNKCQLDSINALEPDNLIESEAGVTETWNANHPELRCAGVAFIKRTINAKGLHLPSYVNFPELHFIVQECYISATLEHQIKQRDLRDEGFRSGSGGELSRQLSVQWQATKGSAAMVPQNFVVAEQAGSEGLEYIAFKTSDRATISTLVGPTSATRAFPAEVLANAYGLSPQEVSALKNNRNEAVLVSPVPQSQSHDAYIAVV